MPRHFRQPSHFVAFFVFVGVVLVAGFLAKDWATRATVGDVELAVQRGPNVDAVTARHLTIGGRKLPDWSATGWRLIGGRTDRFLDDRDAISGIYARQGQELSVTIIAGDGGLEDSGETSGALSCSAGCVGPVSRPALYVKRALTSGPGRDAATMVVVGAPVDDGTRAALREVVGDL